MSNRAVFRTAASVFLACLLVVAACGRSGIDENLFPPSDDAGLGPGPDAVGPPGCNATTCAQGCCDANGVCLPGAATSACGTMGQACRDCPAAGFPSCDVAAHACMNSVGRCDASNCKGCCAGNVCFMGSDPNQCGSGGAACQQCASSGLACTGQQCVPAPRCGPSNCSGCCVGQLCLPGNVQTACGQNGAQCSSCPPGDACLAGANGRAGGTCAPSPCNPMTCTTGCCDAFGVCQSGVANTLCGGFGNRCQNCFPLGEQCSNRQCVVGPDAGRCSAQSCPLGCCDAFGICQRGLADTSCGAKGNACQNCLSFGDQCLGGQCTFVPRVCNAQTCPFGCCDGAGGCQIGVTSTQCGNGGGFCQNCLSIGEQCLNRQCTFVPRVCNAQTCPFGCCDDVGTCQLGFVDTQCGGGGVSCQNCASFGEQCFNRQCLFVPQRCNPMTCPFGCCDAFGTCTGGFANTQCGNFGRACQDCSQGGGQCANQQCVVVPDGGFCDPQTCPGGCCDAFGVCRPGASNTQCGNGSGFCQDCTQFGQECSGQQCAFLADAGACNAQTCPTGCCDSSGQCQQGLTAAQCGNLGTNCQNCLQNGQLCSAIQRCVLPAVEGGTACNAQTCPTGCCDAFGTCQTGQTLGLCGNFGNQCLDCLSLGGQCLNQACTVADGGSVCSQTCSGCCDANGSCQGGFVNTQCGEVGHACRDCTALQPASTCDANVFPRACSSQQTQCPAPYPNCPTGLQQRAPTRQRVCSTAELQNAGAACSGGPNTAACSAFLMFESSTNAACASCLQPFDVEFAAQSGIRTCVAPFLDATCNHNSACIVDCTSQSCFGCLDAASTLLCETQAPMSSCASFAQADQCVTQALGGAAAVCNPSTYQGSFGGWLQGVGAAYCAR